MYRRRILIAVTFLMKCIMVRIVTVKLSKAARKIMERQEGKNLGRVNNKEIKSQISLTLSIK